MRGVMEFLVWLFSLWTWFEAFIMVGWFKMRSLDQGRVDLSVGLDLSQSNEGEHESALIAFLLSLPKDTRGLSYGCVKGRLELSPGYGGKPKFLVDEATHGEFVATIASSKLETYSMFFLGGYQRPLHLKHIEEVVGALVSNKNFKKVELSFCRCTTLQMVQCVSKLLSGNKAIEDLEVNLYEVFEEVVGKEAAKLLANGLRENQILKILNMSCIFALVEDEAMEVLIKPLKDNDSVLQNLCFGAVTNVGLEHLGVMLATNTSLLTLSCWRRFYDSNMEEEVFMKGYTSLSKALCINKSLKVLDCSVESSIELKVLLEPLMPVDNNPQANATLTSLSFWDSTIGGKEGVDVLTNMICTNTSLLTLYLPCVRELGSGDLDAAENVVAIVEALKTNKSLKKLVLWDCAGVGGYKVLGTIMDMMLENNQLQEIDLRDTPLQSSGDAKYVQHELEKRKKMKVWDLIRGMASVSPKSGRVFLCGNPRAGKTTLRMSIKELPGFQNRRDARHTKFERMKKVLEWRLGTSKVPKRLEAMPEIERTRGIEVDHIECDGIGISIWDMAGQADYHSFHDLVIPNLSADGSCSLFLLTCNPMNESSLKNRSIFDIKHEVEYWLRFIASNTRRSWQYRAHVSIVMTHKDQWHTQVDFQRRIEDVIVELKSQFEEVLEFDHDKKVFMVNGREGLDAGKVFDFMKSHFKQLLARLPKTIKACSEVQCLIARWNQEVSKEANGGQTSKLPMLKWEEFSDKFCKGVVELQDGDKELARRKQEFVAISLNDGGHIMYHEEGKFVITNPHWFCHDIMGEFLHHCATMDSTLEVISTHAIISIEHVKRILMDISRNQWHEGLLDATLSMMKKLHMCYEKDDKNIMIPSFLQDKRETRFRLLRGEKIFHVGRRLSCKDAKRTMLSLGFFPRLQVSFFQKFENNNTANSYQLFQDVIMFICKGIEVIIEFDHIDIDIMLMSKLCQDKMLEFLENGIVRHIQDRLMNPTLGCPGVILVEHILRPECIEELIVMKDRKDQFVSIEELELEVVKCGFGATHNWKQCGHLKRPFDEVKDLLGKKAWAKLLKKRHDDLERYQKELLHMASMKVQKDFLVGEKGVDTTQRLDSLGSSMVLQTLRKPINFVRNLLLEEVNEKFDEVISRVDNIDQKLDVAIGKLDDILQMQEEILKMQNNLLCEVSSRIDDLMDFSIKMQQSQVPKLAYLSEVGHKKLLTRFVPNLIEYDLHLRCESRIGIHEVVDQEGCKVNFGTDWTRAFVTMLVWGLKVATILTKIGAHVAGGMGGMVPDIGDGLQLAGLILDTAGIMDQMSASCLKSLPNNVRESINISKDDRSIAEEWLIEVLEPKCKEESIFYRTFGLRKVVYGGVGCEKGSIAWLCDNCRKNGMESGVLYNAKQ